MVYTFSDTFVCFLDILGFSKYVLSLNDIPKFKADPILKQKELLKYYNIIYPLVIGPVYGQFQNFSNTQAKKIVQTQKPRLNSYIVSDSILLWTDDCSYQNFILLVDAVKHIIMTNFSWMNGFPIRGAISKGSLSFNNVGLKSSKVNFITSLVGDALVKAVNLERVQNWAGCAVDSEVMKFLQEKYPDAEIDHELHNWRLITKYPIPMRLTKGLNSEYAIVWPSEFDIKKQKIYDLPIQITFERNGPFIDQGIQEKYNNTIKYVHDLIEIFSE